MTRNLCNQNQEMTSRQAFGFLSDPGYYVFSVFCGCTAQFVPDLVRNEVNTGYKQDFSKYTSYEPCHEKTCFLHTNTMRKIKTQNRSANQYLCFRYIDSTYPLLWKFQDSSHILWMYSTFCVRPGGKPPKQVFSWSSTGHDKLSRVMRKPTFCICENKDADQLRGNREADQRLCFRYLDSTIPLLSKYKISSL